MAKVWEPSTDFLKNLIQVQGDTILKLVEINNRLINELQSRHMQPPVVIHPNPAAVPWNDIMFPRIHSNINGPFIHEPAPDQAEYESARKQWEEQHKQAQEHWNTYTTQLGLDPADVGTIVEGLKKSSIDLLKELTKMKEKEVGGGS